MFNILEEQQRIFIELASEIRHVDRAILEARHFLEKCGSCKAPLEFNIVLRELLLNAIEHGNMHAVEKLVKLDLEALSKGLFRLRVRDEGRGFDHRNAKLAIPENPRQTRNRGLPLVQELSEKVEFNKRGNEVKVLFSIALETEFKVGEHDGWQIIRPSGDITAAVAGKFSSLLTDLEAKGCSCFRFDFRQVLEIDSISLSILIVLARTLAEKNGQAGLEIVNASSSIRNLFQLTRLDALYRLVPA